MFAEKKTSWKSIRFGAIFCDRIVEIGSKKVTASKW